MILSNIRARIAIIILLLVIITVTLAIGTLQAGDAIFETFGTVPLMRDKTTNKLINGYYQVDASNMALVPYGYIVDPSNAFKIIPKTLTAVASLSQFKLNKQLPSAPPPGKPLPEGYYKISDASLATLPPNMSPSVKSIDFSGNPPVLLIYYDNSYVSQTMYYQRQYTPVNKPAILPTGVYYVDASKSKVAFLPYGKLADPSNGYGIIQNPDLNLSETAFNFASSNYRDISNNYSVQFHDSVEDIKKQNDMYDISFGEVRVLDQCGNMIILPKTKTQGNILYYHPGEFPFGASNYVPNYEDSVYLSTIGYRTAFGNKPS